ncbi:MAG TPA: hypothetical protein VF141_21070 [Chryseolinea sp.]
MTVSDIKENVRNWKLTRERVTNFIIGFAALLIYEFIARPIYRPYIYKNNINDFHLADTIGNTLGVMAAIFVLIGFIGQGRTQHLFLIKTITIAMVVYEIGQPLLGKSIDSWDIVATIITGGICLVLYNSVHPKPLEKEQKTDKT